MIKTLTKITVFTLLVVAGIGCSTTVELNAPEKPIWVVFGVLSRTDSVQTIRVSRGFLSEGSATKYAQNNDLSLKDLVVRIEGAGKSYLAVEVDSVVKNPPNGLFFPTTTVYQIVTDGADALQGGSEYRLEVTDKKDSDFLLTAIVLMPEEVAFTKPFLPPGAGATRCLQQVALESPYTLEFRRGSGVAFELRAFLDYKENGVLQESAVYGPTSIIKDDYRCNSGSGTVCYKIREKEVLISFLADMDQQPGSTYSYGVNELTRCNADKDKLPDVFRFEITAIDSALYKYNQANNPVFSDFNTVRKEYTNIQGPTGEITLGLFAAISTGTAKARLSFCSEYLLNLNGRDQPNINCEF